MKRNDLQNIKKLEINSLNEKINQLIKEIVNLIMDKSMNKLKDKKVIFRKRKDLAQVLTILRQKQLVEELESKKGEKE